MTVRSYYIALASGPRDQAYWFEITGYTDAEKAAELTDIQTLYPDREIVEHPECYHEFRGTGHKYANRKCGENIAV